MNILEIGRIVGRFCEQDSGPRSLEHIENLMLDASPTLRGVDLSDEILPYGRYLLWEHSRGLANIQVDVFSESYEGLVHSHATWGMLHVLKGQLILEDWEERSGEYAKSRSALLSPGSSQCFCPPVSDWHKVRTGSGRQVVSLHIYGQGFNLETGTYLDEHQRVQQKKRGPMRDFAEIQQHFIDKKI